jgi:hypothetical protein
MVSQPGDYVIYSQQTGHNTVIRVGWSDGRACRKRWVARDLTFTLFTFRESYAPLSKSAEAPLLVQDNGQKRFIHFNFAVVFNEA